MYKYKNYKYTVQWVDDNTQKVKVHGTYETYLEAWWSIKEWWKSNNFTPKYVRAIGEPVVDDVVVIDYGMHSAYYQIVKVHGGSTMEDKMTLQVFEFTPVNGNTIEKTWRDIKMDYPDAVFKQVIVKDDYHVGMLLAFI